MKKSFSHISISCVALHLYLYLSNNKYHINTNITNYNCIYVQQNTRLVQL